MLLYQKLNCRPVESRYENPNFDECFPTDPRILALVNYWVLSDVGDADYLYDDEHDYLVYKLYGSKKDFYVQLYGNRKQEWFILVVANGNVINNLNAAGQHVTEQINFSNLETKEGNIDYNSIATFVDDIRVRFDTYTIVKPAEKRKNVLREPFKPVEGSIGFERRKPKT